MLRSIETESEIIDEKSGLHEKSEFSSQTVSEHIIEIVSDSGEGAQKAGQSFGSVSAKMGNGVWTVEIIPAEIKPPSRSRAGVSGNRIRIGTDMVTNMGDEADLVVAFNEQVLYGRIDQDAYREGTLILLENKWKDSPLEEIQAEYAEAMKDFEALGYDVREIPMDQECKKIVENPQLGKNMWVLGMLCFIYDRNLERAEDQIRHTFRHKKQAVVDSNLSLLNAGYFWARSNLDFQYHIPVVETKVEKVVMNGNEAVGMGVMAAGIEVCSMYPITPATSVTHYLSEVIESSGGMVHQAEDEIAAAGFALGVSYAGKTAVTITSGPGMALKTEFLGLGVMAELPLVVVDVQRGGPSTGLPTKVEQGDLLYSLFGQPGDNPNIVIAPATIEECFHFVILARQLAETFRIPVVMLTDANLATGVQPFPRPETNSDWFSPPVDQSPWNKEIEPYQWNEETGISPRPIPGQPDGMYVLTGLAHDEQSHVAYESHTNQLGCNRRSRKLSAFQKTLTPPKINGPEEGDLLVVGWGSTLGAIEEAVSKARDLGGKVSSLQLRFLSPLEPGLKEIFSKFRKVITVEINYGDELGDSLITPQSRRYAQLATLLRAYTLCDIDFHTHVHGQPMRPGFILKRLIQELSLSPENKEV
tara:strand:+ start:3266 stop:5197 length:1932 start_codon:yes stop_codon:yes gene_type:complete